MKPQKINIITILNLGHRVSKPRSFGRDERMEKAN
jgi:hypothetical protein